MAAENWRQVRGIFDAALRQRPEVRNLFVNRACDGDNALHKEVESLLASFDSAEDFMETPAISEVADQILTDNRQFADGQMLGHYRIVRRIGAGGMGEVYLAADTKLNRKVAIKVLHPNLLSDHQANGRLLREAQAAALLDHPHICAIHEISEIAEVSFIVMQYVDGETLADILTEKRLSVENSLDVAIQIGDALTAAHSHLIIHRDIKPANIIVNEKWHVKVLDFGLAKFIEAETNAETVRRLKSSGAVMGTVPYMSPEQLRGKRLDSGTDIFSFGTVLYEMLSGAQAFSRENTADTISAILNDEPDLTKIPRTLWQIMKKSLMKNKGQRYQTAADLTQDLREVRLTAEFSPDTDGDAAKPQETNVLSDWPFPRFLSRKTSKLSPNSRESRFWRSAGSKAAFTPETGSFADERTSLFKAARLNRPAIFSVSTIFLFVIAAVWLAWELKTNTDPHSFDALRPVRLVAWKSGAGSDYTDYRVSHSGKMIAYSSTQNGGKESIYVKQTNDSEEIRITKDDWTNYSPIWSPDDQRLGFVSVRDDQSGIFVCPSLGGTPVPIKMIGKGKITLAHWSNDGKAVFYEYQGNLFRLELESRETLQITDFSASPGKRYFNVSPDEGRVAFCEKTSGQTDIWLMPAEGGTAQRLTDDKEEESCPLWHPDGERILYNVTRDRRTQINVAYTDGRAPEQVTRGESGYELLELSADGAKIYYTTWEKRSDISSVNIESGEESEIAAGIESEFWAETSPDNRSILFQTNSEPHLTPFLQESSIVVKTMANHLPDLKIKGYGAHWLPNSSRIAFLRWQETEQKYDLWLGDTVNGEEHKLTTNGVSPPSIGAMPINRLDISSFDCSPDESRCIYLDSKKQNIWTVSIGSLESTRLTDNHDLNVQYFSPLWSPDGKRIVFISTEKPNDKIQKPTWSVWLAEQSGLRKIHTTNASLRLLGWSGSDGKLLFATTDGPMTSGPLNVELMQVSAGGESTVVSTFNSTYARSMTLSRDGRTVVFTARRNDKDDLWTASTNGGESKKITSNGNSRLFFGSPAWSADGKTVLFDKQDQINTISMFENFQ